MIAFTHVETLLCACLLKDLKTIIYLFISLTSFAFYLDLPMDEIKKRRVNIAKKENDVKLMGQN